MYTNTSFFIQNMWFLAILGLFLASCSSNNSTKYRERNVGFPFDNSIEGLEEEEGFLSEKSVNIFLKTLNTEYKTRAEYFKRMGQYPNAQSFLEKAKMALKGDVVHETEDSYMLERTARAKATEARIYMDSIRQNAHLFNSRPVEVAKLQVLYDCMLLEQRDKTYQRNPSLECTKKFDEARRAFGSDITAKTANGEDILMPRRQTFAIYFDLGSAVIKPEFQSTIKKAAAAAKEFEAYQIRIVGLADRTGNRELNAKLSGKRAENVRDELLKAGIPEFTMKVEHFASDYGLVRTNHGVPEKFNRRVVIDVVAKD